MNNNKNIKDTFASLALGAVPAFLGTAFLACIYSAGSGLATASGMTSGAATAVGLIGTVVFGGTGLTVGAIAGGTGLFGVAASPMMRGAHVNGRMVALGAVLGVAGSVALAHELTKKDVPVQPPLQQQVSLKKAFEAPMAAMPARVAVTDLRNAPKFAL